MSKSKKFRTAVTLVAGAMASGVAFSVIASSCALLQDLLPLDDSYMPRAKIEAIIEELGLDSSIMFKSDAYRMRHKNGKPINVYYDESFPENYMSASCKAVEYFFGLVKDINPNYNYEIIEQRSLADITIKSGNLSHYSAGGMNADVVGLADQFSDVITIDTNCDALNQADEEGRINLVFNTTAHELAHLFGFNDIYNIKLDERGMPAENEVLHSDSIMMTASTSPEQLSYNDYGNLLAFYTPNVSDEQLPACIENLRQKLNEYAKQLFSTKQFVSSLAEEGIETCDKIDHAELEYVRKKISNAWPETHYYITIDNNTFKIEVQDEHDQPIVIEGETVRLDNNAVLLPNVNLPDFRFDKNKNAYHFYSNVNLNIALKDGKYYLMYNSNLYELTDLQNNLLTC